MVFAGTLLAESLRQDVALDAVPLTVRRVWRADAGDPSVNQPVTWTFIAFEVPDDGAETLAAALVRALAPGPWYCDFHSDRETFVVFADRVFRYAPGDEPGRERAERHARAVGVPEAQIDWPV